MLSVSEQVNGWWAAAWPSPELVELRNVVQCALLVVRCAILRKESRGLHYTADYPYRDSEHWLRDTIVVREGGDDDHVDDRRTRGMMNPADDSRDPSSQPVDGPAPDPAAFRFDFDDVVRVVSDDPELAPINGKRGAICGRGDDTTQPGYAVFIYRLQRVWCVDEHDLESTGERDPRSPPTHAIRVAVDEQGRGNVVGIRKL